MVVGSHGVCKGVEVGVAEGLVSLSVAVVFGPS